MAPVLQDEQAGVGAAVRGRECPESSLAPRICWPPFNLEKRRRSGATLCSGIKVTGCGEKTSCKEGL